MTTICRLLFFCAVLVQLTAGQVSAEDHSPAPRRLRISESGHYFVDEQGQPFFWLGDTAWLLFSRLTLSESDEYLDTRAAQGFTVIQAMVLPAFGLMTSPNREGAYALQNGDPLHPNDAYFRHIDAVVDKANRLGLIMALVPTWGDKVTKAWGEGPEIFNAENAAIFGQWLGNRYKDKSIVWIIGGDRDPTGYEDIWRALARGVKEGSENKVLATFHGGSNKKRGSSPYFHSEPWLDFNFTYSGHRWHAPTYKYILHDRELKPAKPTLDGEPLYENCPLPDDDSYYFQSPKLWDGITRGNSRAIRLSAYWSMLAGAAGHTYGCNDVWQMNSEYYEPLIHSNVSWKEALKFVGGARQMGLMRRLFESRPWQTLVPAQSLIKSTSHVPAEEVRVAQSTTGAFLFAYLPRGGKLALDLTGLSGSTLKAYWFEPRSGDVTEITDVNAKHEVTFTAPKPKLRTDWVLVVDDASQGFPQPGKVDLR